MSNYLATVSWPDEIVQGLRHKETTTVEVSPAQLQSVGELFDCLHKQNQYSNFYNEDIAIDFMMKLGD